MSRIVSNRVRCLECNDVIESLTRHDFVTCTCRNVSIDGGREYLKRSAKRFDLIEDLSDVETVLCTCGHDSDVHFEAEMPGRRCSQLGCECTDFTFDSPENSKS